MGIPAGNQYNGELMDIVNRYTATIAGLNRTISRQYSELDELRIRNERLSQDYAQAQGHLYRLQQAPRTIEEGERGNGAPPTQQEGVIVKVAKFISKYKSYMGTGILIAGGVQAMRTEVSKAHIYIFCAGVGKQVIELIATVCDDFISRGRGNANRPPVLPGIQ